MLRNIVSHSNGVVNKTSDCLPGEYMTLILTLRLHVRRQPSFGRRQCENKTSASGTQLYKIITQLHPQRRMLRKAMPLAQLLNRVYATNLLAQPCRGHPFV